MKKCIAFILSIFTLLIGVFSALGATEAAQAETTVYSDVLDDLEQDPTFTGAKYPKISNDYSVSVITIAEGVNGELFVYVYQPSNDTIDLRAIKISISVGFSVDGQDLSPSLYNLELVSTAGVYDKYLVKDIVIPNERSHYYNLVAIYRNFNSLIDDSIEGGFTDGKSYPIGQQWCCFIKDGTVTYEMNTFGTVEITPTLNGNVYYDSGFSFNDILGISDSCNSHFLAFNVENFDVRHIYDANLTYSSRVVKTVTTTNSLGVGGGTTTTYPNGEEYIPASVKLTDGQTQTYQGEGLGAKTYTWKRIMTAQEFIKNFQGQGGVLVEGALDVIKESEYVFCFAETENSTYIDTMTSDGIPPVTYTTRSHTYTSVREVTVLTLHFMDVYEDVYNLGVVADITTADNLPDGSASGYDFDQYEEWWEKLVALICVIIGLMLFWNPLLSLLKVLLRAIWHGIKLLFKLLWGLLTFPFRGRSNNKKR